MVISFIVVRIKDKVHILFENDFIGNGENKEYYTQNILTSALRLLYNEKDFDVMLYIKEIK